MSKAFARVPASELEAALDANNLPDVIELALRAAIKACREDPRVDGEAPIEVFIVDDTDEDSDEIRFEDEG
jgi:hypothetical protein